MLTKKYHGLKKIMSLLLEICKTPKTEASRYTPARNIPINEKDFASQWKISLFWDEDYKSLEDLNLNYPDSMSHVLS